MAALFNRRAIRLSKLCLRKQMEGKNGRRPLWSVLLIKTIKESVRHWRARGGGGWAKDGVKNGGWKMLYPLLMSASLSSALTSAIFISNPKGQTWKKTSRGDFEILYLFVEPRATPTFLDRSINADAIRLTLLTIAKRSRFSSSIYISCQTQSLCTHFIALLLIISRTFKHIQPYKYFWIYWNKIKLEFLKEF